MIRVLSLAILTALLLFAWKFGTADPERIGAFESGAVAGEPLSLLEGPAWRDYLGQGDHVLVEPDGDVWSIGDLADTSVKLTREGEPDRTVARSALLSFVSSERSLLAALENTAVFQVTGEGDAARGTLHLGPGTYAPWQGANQTAGQSEGLSRDARLSMSRALRAHFSEVVPLQDQDLSVPDPTGPSLSVERTDPDRLMTMVQLSDGTRLGAERKGPLPGPFSLAPPLIAILLAILFRRPVLALFAGVLGGAWVVFGMRAGSFLQGALDGTPAVGTRYLKQVLEDQFYLSIVGFVAAMLAMVGIMTRAGGVQGLMNSIAKLAGNARKTQIATWFMGLAVFFDDYANTILVGSTMRPLTDRFKVAREKLAYIVDSTAAPVAGLSLFSTWIAFEVSTFTGALPDAGLSADAGYSIFLQTLPYRFYCLFTLAFVGLLVFTGRDFGPMLRAERRARGGQLLAPGATPMVGKAATEMQPEAGVIARARVALIPLLVFVGGTIFTILWNGNAFHGADLSSFQGWADVLYDGSGEKPLLYGSLAGLAVAIVLGFMQGLRGSMIGAAWASIRSMGVAILILYLAWMLGAVCGDLGTSTYLTVQLSDAIPPLILPVALFLLASLVAFSTGSSWSTMTILLPLVVGLSFQLGETSSIGGFLLLVMSIGAVLEGSIFGDHCSPISDTTVMSSIASAADHIDHVRTQMPYALFTMAVAIGIGYLPCAYFLADTGGWLPYACLAIGFVTLAVCLLTFGKKAEDPQAT